MTDKNIREKKHRLSLNCYQGRLRVTFTLCIDGKINIFTTKDIVERFTEILKESVVKHNCKNWVYVFMPDHLHLIMEGNDEKSDLWKMINLFKQKTGFWFSQNTKGVRWQKSFYDHIHRNEEKDLTTQIRYILDNPVRKNLVAGWQEYPFSGSLGFDLKAVI